MNEELEIAAEKRRQMKIVTLRFFGAVTGYVRKYCLIYKRAGIIRIRFHWEESFKYWRFFSPEKNKVINRLPLQKIVLSGYKDGRRGRHWTYNSHRGRSYGS